MRLSRNQIAERIPHAGRMVLLDEVVEWDEEHIVCRSSSHQDRANPLYLAGQLSSVCAIEYAAQAMAVHGSLLMGGAARSNGANDGSGDGSGNGPGTGSGNGPSDGLDGAADRAATRPRAGFLASVRNVRMEVARLDGVHGALTIEARRESGDEARVLYDFEVRAGERLLVSGRAAVVLDAEGLLA